MNENGQALGTIVATKENAEYVMMLFPDWLSPPFANFDGRVWKVGCVDPPQPVPLIIANRPVLVPVRAQTPLSTAFLPARLLPDPLPEISVSADVWMSEHHVRFAFSRFPGCLGFMVFFDRRMLVIFPKGHDCIQATNGLPETFGGLMLGAAEEAGRFSGGGGEQTERSENTMTAPALPTAPPTVRPGEPIYLHGPLYGAAPSASIAPEDLSQIAPLYGSQKASIGLLLDLGEEGHMLTTVSHLAGEHLRAIDRALGYIRAKRIAVDGLGIWYPLHFHYFSTNSHCR